MRADREFFAGRGHGDVGLAVFLNAGDPPLDVLPDVCQMLDESGVDCLELAVPFPDSATDGPVVRRSARRALDARVGLDDVLDVLDAVHSGLKRLRVALLVDWSHTVRPLGLRRFVGEVADSAADALLVHGLPPVSRTAYHHLAAERCLPVVTTCYPGSSPEVRADSARNASAYLYLVSHYGRTGGTAGQDSLRGLDTVIAGLREQTGAPVAVGFGVRGPAEVEALRVAGADAVVVGSAAVAAVDRARAEDRDVVAELAGFVAGLRPSANHLQQRHT